MSASRVSEVGMMGGEHDLFKWKRLVDWLAIWLGSFLLVSLFLIVLFRVPLGPLLLGGGFTLVMTVVRALRTR